MTPPPNVPSVVKQRSLFRLRRRADKVWLVAGLLSMSFSLSVFVYKLKFEPAPAAVPASAAPMLEEEVPEDLDLIPEEDLLPPQADPLPEVLPPAPVAQPQPEPLPEPARKPPRKKEPKPAKKPAPRPVKAAPPPPPYEALKARNPWRGLFDGGGRMSVRFDDSNGKAIQLTFDLQDGKWVHAVQDVSADFSAYSRLKFSFRGEGDEGNNVEFVVADEDGTTRVLSFMDQAHVARWKAVDVPLTALKAGRRGEDGKMDWGKVARVILRISGHSWTKGTVWYKDVRFE